LFQVASSLNNFHESQGGESQALARMEDYLKDSKWVCGFEKPQTDPSAFERPATTVLSPYLKFGCLSPRLFHSRLVAVYRIAKGTHSKPPVSLRGQLLWREFFYTVGKRMASSTAAQPCQTGSYVLWADLIRTKGLLDPADSTYRSQLFRRADAGIGSMSRNNEYAVVWLQVGSNTPNFNQMVGNPLAKQIPWDTNPTTLAAWKEGNTGEGAPVCIHMVGICAGHAWYEGYLRRQTCSVLAKCLDAICLTMPQQTCRPMLII
jgi:deoxyribodipyrimidine photolyase